MTKLRKVLTLAAAVAALAASSLLFKPVRAWASVEGSYVYNLLALRGPIYAFKSNIGGGQGLYISTNTYTGASALGVPTLSGTVMRLVGAVTSSARDTCNAANEGEHVYDFTVHSFAFCDGTGWHKLVTGSGANDTWTTY